MNLIKRFTQLLVAVDLIYDPSTALVPTAQKQPKRRKIVDKYKGRRIKNYSLFAFENEAESNIEAGVLVQDIVKDSGEFSPELSEQELLCIQEQRDKTKLSLPYELCQNIKNELSKGFSLSQIAKTYEGKKGYSLRSIKAVSAAIRKAQN